MNLSIQGLFIDPVLNGTIGGTLGVNETCSSTFAVTAKTVTSAWLSWSNGSGIVTIGGLPAVNGQTITSITNLDLVIYGYAAPNMQLNNSIANVTFYLHDLEGGTLIDSKEFTRFFNGDLCLIG